MDPASRSIVSSEQPKMGDALGEIMLNLHRYNIVLNGTRGWCGILKRMVWYIEEGGTVL